MEKATAQASPTSPSSNFRNVRAGEGICQLNNRRTGSPYHRAFASRRVASDGGLDVRSEAMAAGYLHSVHKICSEDLRYRARSLTQENAIEIRVPRKLLRGGARCSSGSALR